VLSQIHQLRGGRPTAVLVTGYWAVFEDGDVAAAGMSGSGRTTADELTRTANAELAVAAHSAGSTYVDLYHPFKGEQAENDPTPLLAGDGDHPNAAGHRLIARTLLAAGLAPLAPR
jgi:lysophospholipase L1-like esterase